MFKKKRSFSENQSIISANIYILKSSTTYTQKTATMFGETFPMSKIDEIDKFSPDRLSRMEKFFEII